MKTGKYIQGLAAYPSLQNGEMQMKRFELMCFKWLIIWIEFY